jgi:putative pyruvate formate lyase activating enzyme
MEMNERLRRLKQRLTPCIICPHHCRVDRTAGDIGRCRTTDTVRIASYNLHWGEEPPISGKRGSGTIFFSCCTLSCVFCQNYPISYLGNGNPYSIDQLADIMIELQDKGAHNINLVTPSHVTPQIVDAFLRARSRGLVIPLVYNCSGYEDVETLRLLDGVIDIYLPDMKYSDDRLAEKYSGVTNYWTINTSAVKEMYRQAGNLSVDTEGVALKGLIVRHMVLPNNISGSRKVLEFIARELSPQVHVSLMAQYHPAHKACDLSELARRITKEEYSEVIAAAEMLGLENGWQQEI